MSARAQSQNNLKQIGLALHNHDSAYGLLPVSSFTPDGRPLHSWQTGLLPFIEQETLYQRITFDRPWNHPSNAETMVTRVKVFLHPLAAADAVNGYAPTHYAANVLTLGGDKPKQLMSGFPQGLSNTVFAGEATTKPRAWGDPLNWRDPRLGINAHPDGFGGPTRQGGINVLMGDGSVRFVSDKQAKGLLDGKFEDD